MNKLYEYQKKQQKNATKLRELALDDRISQDKIDELRKEQKEAYNKYNFIKDFRKAINKIEKSDK